MVEQGSSESPVVRIERRIAAPAERVCEAWLDPELITRWMAPADLWVTSAEVDPRVGGHFRIRQESPQGGKGGFDADIVELEPGRRLVFDWYFVGPEGIQDDSIKTRLTLTFEEDGEGGTLLTLVHDGLGELRQERPDIVDNVEFGWGSALDKLPAVLA